MRKFFILLLSSFLFLGIAPLARAQQSLATATLYTVEASGFPTVSALLDVFDSQKIFASGINPEAVTVIENGQPLPVDSLNEIAVPLQLVVAVNQGTPLDARNANGLSRFQRVSQVLVQWAESRPADLPDDLSLVSQAGPVINHANAADFIVGLKGFQPDLRAATPNLQSLTTAIDTVTAQTPRLGMKRAILFITPQMDDPNLAAALEAQIQRAVENNIRVFVWYVDANTTFTNTSAAVFNNLAIQTGGTMFQYSGEERFPDPEVYFSALRRVYALAYTSRITVAGEYPVTLQINLASGGVTSNEQKFNVDIQPPNPFPVAPVLQITRQAPAEDPYNTEILLPESQEIEIIVEFPDGHPRPLTRTTLYVNGVAVDENTAEPFTFFTWDHHERRVSDHGRSGGCAWPEENQPGAPSDDHGHQAAERTCRFPCKIPHTHHLRLDYFGRIGALLHPAQRTFAHPDPAGGTGSAPSRSRSAYPVYSSSGGFRAARPGP